MYNSNSNDIIISQDEWIKRRDNAIKRNNEIETNIFKLYNAVKNDKEKRDRELKALESQRQQVLADITTLESKMNSWQLYYVNEKITLNSLIKSESLKLTSLEEQLKSLTSSPSSSPSLTSTPSSANTTPPISSPSSVSLPSTPILSPNILSQKNNNSTMSYSTSSLPSTPTLLPSTPLLSSSTSLLPLLPQPYTISSPEHQLRQIRQNIYQLEQCYLQLEQHSMAKEQLLNQLISEKQDAVNKLFKQKTELDECLSPKQRSFNSSISNSSFISNNNSIATSTDSLGSSSGSIIINKQIGNIIGLTQLDLNQSNQNNNNNNSNSKPISINNNNNSNNNIKKHSVFVSESPTIDSILRSHHMEMHEKEKAERLKRQGSSTNLIQTKKLVPVSNTSPDTATVIKTIQYPITIHVCGKVYVHSYSLEQDTILTLRSSIYEFISKENPGALKELDANSPDEIAIKTNSHTYFTLDQKLLLKFIPYFSIARQFNQDPTKSPHVHIVSVKEELEFLKYIQLIIGDYFESFNNPNQESVYFRNKMIFFLESINQQKIIMDEEFKAIHTPVSNANFRVKSKAHSSMFLQPQRPINSDTFKSVDTNVQNKNNTSNGWISCTPKTSKDLPTPFLNQQLGQTSTIRVYITNSMVKTFLCHVQITIGELIDRIYSKFSKIIQISIKEASNLSISDMKSKFVFKIRGLEIYLMNPKIQLSSIDYINTKSRRQKKIDLLLLNRDTIDQSLLDSHFKSYITNNSQSNNNNNDNNNNTKNNHKTMEIDEIELSNYPNLSYKLSKPFKIRIGGVKQLDNEKFKNTRIYVACQLYHCGHAVGEEFITSTMPLTSNCSWLEWLEGPKYNIIPSNAILSLSIRSSPSNQVIGWVNFRIWDYKNALNSGFHQLRLWMNSKPDSGETVHDNKLDKTPVTLSIEIEVSLPAVLYQSLPPSPISNDPMLSSDEELSFQEMQQLTLIIDKDPLTDITQEENELCWKHRHYCKYIPKATSKLILSVPWSNPESVEELYSLLDNYTPLEPVDTLELLSSKFLDKEVRKFAIRTLSRMNDQELLLYLPQLVQALKHEPNHYSSLAKFLLKRVLMNRQHMGHHFFWQLKAEISNLNRELHSEWVERYSLLLESFLKGSGQSLVEIGKQYELYNGLKTIALGVKNVAATKRKEYLATSFSNFKLSDNYQLPINPEFRARGINVQGCKVMESKTLPLWLSFQNHDLLGDNLLTIFKAGDDLRQDQLTIQMIDLMDKMWLAEGIDLQTISYKCIATGPYEGMIEVVGEAVTIAEIQKLSGGITAAFSETSIQNWLKQHNPSEFEYNQAVENFVRSCAACCVYTLVLGIGDRHNDNIMITKSGHLFHIDFGRFLGNVQTFGGIKRERGPFVFPPSFNQIIGQHFKTFEDLCGKAYNVIRKKANIFINLFLMMVSTGMPELNHRDDVLYLKEVLALDLTSEQAAQKFSSMIKESLNTMATNVNFMVHIAFNPN